MSFMFIWQVLLECDLSKEKCNIVEPPYLHFSGDWGKMVQIVGKCKLQKMQKS
jgi:hypothetical protein